MEPVDLTVINPREYDAYLHYGRALRLAERYPQLALAMRAISPSRSSTSDRALFAMLKAHVDHERQQLQDCPFLSPPPIVSDGYLTLATVGSAPLRLTHAEALRGILASGSSGSGKTTFLRHFLKELLRGS